MKRRWKIALTAVALIAVATALALLGDSEPEYKERTLSQWIFAYDEAISDAIQKRESTDTAKSSEAAQALREMTPQILPTLIERLKYDNVDSVSPIKQVLESIAASIGLGPQYRKQAYRKENHVWAALGVFDVLGTNATPALPQLSNMVMDAKHPIAAENALQAISSTGTAGTRTVLSLLHNPNNPNLTATLGALILCANNDPDIVTKELHLQLTNSDAKIRQRATNALEACV